SAGPTPTSAPESSSSPVTSPRKRSRGCSTHSWSVAPPIRPIGRRSWTTRWCRLAVSIVDRARDSFEWRMSLSETGSYFSGTCVGWCRQFAVLMCHDLRKALGLALASRDWLHDAAVAVSRVQRVDGKRHGIHRAALG